MNEKTELELNSVKRLSNEESGALTRRCICSATVKLISERGYDNVTITDIINRSGVSRATFYRHYKTKEEVISDYCTDIRANIENKLRDALFSQNKKEWYAGIFREIAAKSDNYGIMLKAGIKLTDLFPPGDSSEESDAKSHYAAIGLRHAFCAILEEWFLCGMKQPPDEMGTICESLFQKNT